MKRRFFAALILAALLTLQLTPLAYAETTEALAAPPEAVAGQVAQPATEALGNATPAVPTAPTNTAATSAPPASANVKDPAMLPGAPGANANQEQGQPQPPALNGGQTAEGKESKDSTDPLLQKSPQEQSTAVDVAPQTAIAQLGEELAPMAEEVSVVLTITGLKVENGFVVPSEWATGTRQLDPATNAGVATMEFLNSQADTLSFSAFESSYGFYLQSITKGTTQLGDASSSSGYSYWEFFVNGVPSGTGASSVLPEEGSVWEWRYNDAAQAAFASQAVEVEITGVESIGGVNAYVSWLAPARYYDTSVSALAATLAVLERYHLAYTLDHEDTFLSSITKADGSLTLGPDALGEWSYWEFCLNGESMMVGAGDASLKLKAGDRIEFRYAATGSEAPVEVITHPDAPRPNFDADNAGFVSNRVVDAEEQGQLPTSANNTTLAFKTAFKAATSWDIGYSDLLLVNNNVYLPVGRTLVMYDGTTGVKLAETQLAHTIHWSTSRMLYTQGLIIVPLNGGRLQAFTADTLTCVWITKVLPTVGGSAHQSITTLVEQDGCIYYGTGVSDPTSAGSFLCVSAETGEVLWQKDNATSGYYWAGAVAVDSYVYMAGDDGLLISYSTYDGYPSAVLDLGAPVRSTLTWDGTYLYAVDTAGSLHRIALGAWGALEHLGSISVAAASTSTPVISGSKLFVGGTNADFTGTLAVVDLERFALERSIAAPAPVQSTPLVVNQGGATFVYYTYNTTPGGILCYRLGDTKATELFSPTGTDANWCISSVVASSSGLLYYANDSGNLFALRLAEEGGAWGPSPGSNGGDDTQENNTPPRPGGGRTPVVTYVDAASTTAADQEGIEAATAPTALSAEADEAASAATQGQNGEAYTTLADEDIPEAGGGAVSQGLPLLPLLGVVVAALGLVACAVWFFRTRRTAKGGGVQQ